ncbi:hematopoietic progenitor cell antigen CD34 isoform X2 [Pygocentrus nattereri]|uniref:hematopoietic progenitor cell antigen CD34 isoform X2 n=1 Tax=Pygocentrus nattereri TaxID=42514 RepID=UPI000814ACDC|nr:hematopoietic progenitor cell antigen CD34 isoform X2 [Pygocentrus nattereri]
METLMSLKMRNGYRVMALASVIGLVFFQGVTCDTALEPHTMRSKSAPSLQAAHVRGDNLHPTQESKSHDQVQVLPTIQDQTTVQSATGPEVKQDGTTQSRISTTVAGPAAQQDTQAPQHITTNQPDATPSIKHMDQVVCVEEAAVRGKEAVRLKLKASSSCEENKAKIQSILEHLCHDDSKLEIYQRDHTDEMIISGQCIKDDAKGMTKKFNNDNIKDKVGVVEAVPILVKHSRTVLITVLLAGLLLAALLIVAYILKTHRTQAKGVRLAEESFQVDEQNQGNTLLSVAPLPPQEPLDKPTSNGESPELPPTNGHSATQTPVADTQM